MMDETESLRKQLALARAALEGIINDTYWHDDACKVAQQALREMGAQR